MLDNAKNLTPELIRLRRDFHRHPELGFKEIRTARVVAETLQEIGDICVRTGVGHTGVVGDLGAGEGPTIAIRADMDALPITEQTGADYASRNEGVMHACGHDAHTAILLGIAHLLKAEFARGDLSGTVRFLFQPSEESWDAAGKSGAPRMIDDGALEGVDAVIALHVSSNRPYGELSTCAGWHSAAVTSWLTSVSHDFLDHQAVKTEPLGMGAEDFAYMCQAVPGAMIMVGAALPDGIERGHHTDIFDIDEQVLPLGAAILAETARRFLRGEVRLG